VYTLLHDNLCFAFRSTTGFFRRESATGDVVCIFYFTEAMDGGHFGNARLNFPNAGEVALAATDDYSRFVLGVVELTSSR